MPLDPLLVPLLEVHSSLPPAPEGKSAAERRRERDEARRSADGSPYARYIEAAPDVDEVYEDSVPPDGVAVRVYRHGLVSAGTLVYYHGGGWWSGHPDDSDTRCRTIAAGTGLTVVSVDYRLAPEHRFPAGVEDCYRALEWAAESFGPGWLGVTGESAGGNLAAVMALLARERGGPSLDLQIMEIPAFDLTLSSPSIATYAEGYVLTAKELRWCVENYLGGHDPADPLVSPLFADDLTGLPPAVILTAECDPLADDGSRYAARLRESGVPVTHVEFEGQVHGSQMLTGLLPVARAWRETLLDSIRASLKS
ncbi:alpha/beta hydrolase [Nonomuraea dietziae]|uniref:Acetyl esterase n=1 Tax=Nonomuraea dietziae TaxID=65515 RepID=A0A7W5V285_9ACTN|nr:alpha/beta hydrolase [Nonomuraea dietziae]MBB3729121.1 acetyl esterase [Nonomuraea dietziae]